MRRHRCDCAGRGPDDCVSKKSPGLVSALQQLLKDATAGDPMGGLRWTHKTTRNLAAALRRCGFRVGHVTVARLLRAHDYSLRTNRKRLARVHEPDRNRQFRLLARRRQRFLRQGWPMLSIDTKKKERKRQPFVGMEGWVAATGG